MAVVDKFLTLPDNLSPAGCLELFEREDMLPPDVIDVIQAQGFKTFNQVFLFLRHNGLSLLVQTPENKAAGVCQMGRYKPNKIMQFRSYTINLFGAGRELQGDVALRRRIARTHEGADPEVNIHEYRSLLMLGNDNKFYASPIHLQHRVRPLGENTGHAIRGVIDLVNEGETLSGILRMQDVSMAKMYLLNSGDYEGYDRFCALEKEGLIHEALEVFLLSAKAIQALPRTWSLYRGR